MHATCVCLYHIAKKHTVNIPKYLCFPLESTLKRLTCICISSIKFNALYVISKDSRYIITFNTPFARSCGDLTLYIKFSNDNNSENLKVHSPGLRGIRKCSKISYSKILISKGKYQTICQWSNQFCKGMQLKFVTSLCFTGEERK